MGATISDNSNNKLSFEILRILSAFYINDVCVGVDGGKKAYMYFRKTVGEVPSRFYKTCYSQHLQRQNESAWSFIHLLCYHLQLIKSPTIKAKPINSV
jgi:hypothetical protein